MEDVFEEWNVYAGTKNLVARELNLKSIQASAKLKLIALSGVRRSGKTSVLILLYQLLKKEKEKVAYINLEDSRIKNNPKILDDILKWFGDEGYLLLDEVTSVSDWEGWLARTHELLKGKLKIIVSSSRSNLVVPSKPLRGRILTYELFPLSFEEYLTFKGIQIERTTAGIGKIERHLNEYLLEGGFPESTLLKNPTERISLIHSYFKDIVGLDIAEISGENISTVELFGKYVLEAPTFSASKCLNFFKSLGHKIAKQALLNLEKFSQESYLFFFVPIFSSTIKDRAQYPRKAYPGDTSFLYAISGKSDLGRSFENAVFLELLRKIPKQREIHYWKNKEGFEVDFIIREGVRVKEMIQVCYDLKDEKTRKRELRALVACAESFGLKKGVVITKDHDGKEKVDGVDVLYIPLWKWLLRDSKEMM